MDTVSEIGMSSDAAERRGGGGKLSRTETVTVRLDPRTNYLLEIASRAERRTKSSLIEYAIAAVLHQVPVNRLAEGPQSIASLGDLLWSTSACERFIRLWRVCGASLMDYQEQKIAEVIYRYPGFWRLTQWLDENDTVQHVPGRNPTVHLIEERVRERWNDIVRLANEDIDDAEDVDAIAERMKKDMSRLTALREPDEVKKDD